jgi:hypothetical protein
MSFSPTVLANDGLNTQTKLRLTHQLARLHTSVRSRKCAVDPLMGVSPGALAEDGIWRQGASRR